MAKNISQPQVPAAPSAPSYSKYLTTGGGTYSPEEYANLISSKAATGQALDDPAAAAAFQAANPQYFTNLAATNAAANAANTGYQQAVQAQPNYQPQAAADLTNYTNAVQTPFTFNQNSPQWGIAEQAASGLAQQASDTVGADIASHGGTMSSAMVQGMQNTENQDYTQALAAMLPGMEQNQYSQYEGNISNLGNLASTAAGLNQQGLSNQAGLASYETGQQSTAQANQISMATLAMNEQRYGAEATNQLTTAAVNTVKALGYVPDQQTADILGVPVGTQGQAALQAAETIAQKQQELGIEAENAGTSAENASTNASRLGLDETTQQDTIASNVNSDQMSKLMSAAAGQSLASLNTVMSQIQASPEWDQLTNTDRDSVLSQYQKLSGYGSSSGSTINLTGLQ